ncbi:MAG: glycosyltransferase family 2 protein [Myxococcota bacterium]|nr:glycosyltransferase family 2 protein [Myxococcota bacterium]
MEQVAPDVVVPGRGAEQLPLSVVVLAYDERDNLRPVVEEALLVLAREVPGFELILVDDGSTDGTGPLADELAAADPRVRALHHAQNRGMGAGLRSGFAAARGRYVTFLPADGQIDPADVPRLLALADDVDLVLNVYEQRDDGLYRKILSRGLRLLTWLLTGSRWRNEGPYLIRRELASRFEPRADSFFYNLELVIRCERAGLRRASITSRTRTRLTGSSKVTGGRRILKVARELWRLSREG